MRYRSLTLSILRPENLRRSVDLVNEKLRGTKKLDLFESARIDPKVPVEDLISTLAGFVKEGKFDYIGVSEVRAETLRRANAVCPFSSISMGFLSFNETEQGPPDFYC